MIDALTLNHAIGAPLSVGPSAASCRWAKPTLFLAAPAWFEAERAPWACVRDTIPRMLITTDECTTCSPWEPRRAPGGHPR